MRLYDIIKLSLRMFRARTMRTLLTVLGMGLGIAAILFFVSLGYGLQKTLLEKITTADALVTLDVANNAEENAILTPQAIDELSKIPGVVETSPAAQLRAQARFNDITLDIDALGTTAAFLRLSGTKTNNGTLLDDTVPSGVVITQSIARAFNIEPGTMVGKKISLNIFVPKNNGIASDQSAAQGESIGITEYTVAGVIEGDDNIAYFHLKSIPDVHLESFNQLKVKTSSSAVMGTVRTIVLENKFSVSSLSDTIDQANKVFSAIQITLMFFGLIALGVSAIGMFNTMTIALLERTEEIGIMRSIGASSGSISLMFIVESTIMGFLGSLIGVIMSYIGGGTLNFLINMIAQRFGGGATNLFYTPLWFVIAVIAFGAFVGFMTGVFPARKASRIDPLDALRYK